VQECILSMLNNLQFVTEDGLTRQEQQRYQDGVIVYNISH